MFPQFWILVLCAGANALSNPYCELSCGKMENLLCENAPCRPDGDCGENFKMMENSDLLRQTILGFHNNYRQHVAFGNVSRSETLGAAANMRVLSYSKELEFQAQCTANRCKKGPFREKCLRTKMFKNVGQNTFLHEAYDDVQDQNLVKNYTGEAVAKWFEGISDTTRQDIDNCPRPSAERETDTFVQMVWADTALVGCGGAEFRDTVENVTYSSVVCNYAPKGSIPGRAVYLRGAPASACPREAPPSRGYKGLCGEVRSFRKDRFKAPFRTSGVVVEVNTSLGA